ncbi:MAG: hypothetical protein FJX75_15925 [Armatimonadetes bacterium]|nr:hypothetical protein [Armatimonadota bacterium]
MLTLALTALSSAPCLAQTNLLTNGTFDDAGDGLAAGWMLQADVAQATAVRQATGGADGGAYVEVTRPERGQCDVRPTAGFVNLKPDTAYLLTVSVKTSNAAGDSHLAELQWFAEGGFISRTAAGATLADKWARVAVGPVAPPPGATRVIVLLRCYEPGTYGFDSVALWEVGAVPPNVLRNPGFESDGDGDGVPDAWTPSGEGARADADGAKTGQLNARTEPGASWRQAGVAITPSAKYELTASTRADEFGREFRLAIEWLAAGGEALGTAEMKDQTWKGWQVKTLRTAAPPNAARANIVLENTGPGTVWVDDVTLTERGLVGEIALRLDAPNARGLIRDGVDARAVKVWCEMKSDDPDLALQLRLLDAGGAPLGEQALDWHAGPATWTPDIATLPLGGYRVVAEARRGEETVASAEACLDIVSGDAPGLYFRDDHVALVDGKPWFPIGVTNFGPTSPEADRIVQSGFNLLVTGAFTNGEADQVQAQLAKAEELGAYLIEWNNGHVYGVPSEERHRLFLDSAAKVAGHPRFLGWMCDEALWNGIPLGDVRDGYLAARAAAPSLVFWQNQAPRNTILDLARYCRWADVTGMDIYPVEGADHSDLPNKTLSVVGAEMDKQHQTVDNRKPVWAILQGFGWSAWEKDPALHKRAPTWTETRFMAYDAILHGAVGIIYWGASYEDQESDIWNSLRRMAGELAQLSPALIAQERPSVTVNEGPVIATARRVDGKLWIIAANESDAPAEATLSGLDGVTRLERFAEEGAAPTVEQGSFRDAFEGWGVHVYREPANP